MNTINLTGRLVMDAENHPETYKGQIYGQTQSGRSFYNNSIAVDMGYKNKETGEWVNRTEFFNIRAYAGTADYLYKYIKKGEKILVVGSLRSEEWETKEGNKAKRNFIVVNSVEKFVKANKETAEPTETITSEDISIDEELPFTDIPM